MTLLTNEDKAGIINSHLKNLEYNKFNIQISLIEENAKTQTNTESVASLNAELTDITSRITALGKELDKLV
jgi:hypothetical protein